MWIIDLYMENSGKSPTVKDDWYGYVLAYQGETLHTKEKFEHCVRNRFGRDLEMFLDAITRCQPAQIVVHTDSAYLAGGFERLSRYQENGWKNSKGEEIKHKDLWERIAEHSQDKEILFELGEHEYTQWLKNEIRRRKDAEKTNPGTGSNGSKPAEIRDVKERN